MILLQRFNKHADILCSRKLRLYAMVDGLPEELLAFDKPDGEDNRCFGQWYMLNARRDAHITITSSTGEIYEFKAK